MATYYDQTYTSGIYTYTIRVDMRTSIATGPVPTPLNKITVTDYLGVTFIDVQEWSDEDVPKRITQLVNEQERQIAGVPNEELDNTLTVEGIPAGSVFIRH